LVHDNLHGKLVPIASALQTLSYVVRWEKIKTKSKAISFRFIFASNKGKFMVEVGAG
jgi:hypothetical protein